MYVEAQSYLLTESSTVWFLDRNGDMCDPKWPSFYGYIFLLDCLCILLGF